VALVPVWRGGALVGALRAQRHAGVKKATRGRRGGADMIAAYSHSIVPGGLEVMSSTTLLTSRSSLIIREAIVSSRSYGSLAQSAVMASSLVTARTTTTQP